MSIETIRRQEICPFTLETVQDCHISRTVHAENVCPFTLEPCMERIKMAHYAVSRLKADDSQVPHKVGFKQHYILSGKEIAVPEKGDHKNH